MAKATTRNATPKVIVGKKVPDFTATDTDGCVATGWGV